MNEPLIDFSKIKVLVIDDEEEFAEGVAEILEGKGMQVEIAFSARRALDKYKQNGFDLVITDLKMPEMDGIDLIKQIRNIDASQKIIVLTGVPGQLTPWNPKLARSQQDAFFFASLDRLIKPFRPDKLIEVIIRVLIPPSNTHSVSNSPNASGINHSNRVTVWDFLKDEDSKINEHNLPGQDQDDDNNR